MPSGVKPVPMTLAWVLASSVNGIWLTIERLPFMPSLPPISCRAVQMKGAPQKLPLCQLLQDSGNSNNTISNLLFSNE